MKGEWRGLPDGTPNSDSHKDPTDQQDVNNKGVDWRGLDDCSPCSEPSNGPTKGD